MKKLLVLFILALGLLNLTGCGSYNAMQGKEEKVDQAWSNIQVQEQRRYDLFDNLVKIVKSYATHEKDTLTAVIEARAHASQITVDPKNMTPEKMAEYQKAQGGFSQAMGRLMVLSEKYPNIKADAQYKDLMTSVEGTENRIKISRESYNKEVAEFNTMIRQFPNNIINSMTSNLTRRLPFKGDEGTHAAPKLNM